MKKCSISVALALLLLCAYAATAEKTISFSAKTMSGNTGKKTESTVLEGSATVTVGTLTISGDRIELSGKDYRFVKATGTVNGKDTEKEFSFSAQTLMYDRELEVATFQGDAKLFDTRNDVEASATVISYNQDTEVALLQSDVRLVRKNIDCTSGFALYRRTTSLLELTGRPVVLRDGDEFRADRITVNLDTEYISLDGSVGGVLKDTAKEKEKKTPAAKAGSDLPPGAEMPGNVPPPDAEMPGNAAEAKPDAKPEANAGQAAEPAKADDGSGAKELSDE